MLLSNTGLLKQVGHNVATAELTAGEEETDELSEPGGVVVPRSLGVTVGLQGGVGGHDLVFQGHLLCVLLCSAASSGGHHGQVSNHILGVISLSGSRVWSLESDILKFNFI